MARKTSSMKNKLCIYRGSRTEAQNNKKKIQENQLNKVTVVIKRLHLEARTE